MASRIFEDNVLKTDTDLIQCLLVSTLHVDCVLPLVSAFCKKISASL